jgi:hypothetical protein
MMDHPLVVQKAQLDRLLEGALPTTYEALMDVHVESISLLLIHD